LPQPPQFWGSDDAFTHCEPQVICPAAQVTGFGPPVWLLPTLPSQPSIDTASGAIASAASTERIEVFIATTFRTMTVSVADGSKLHKIIENY